MINGKVPFDVFTSPENPYNKFILSICFIIRKEDFNEIAKNFKLLITVWQVNYLHDSSYNGEVISSDLIRLRPPSDPRPRNTLRSLRKSAARLTGIHNFSRRLSQFFGRGGIKRKHTKRKNIKTKRKKR